MGKARYLVEAHVLEGRSVKLLIADRDIRVLALDTGQLIRQLILDPSRDYQPIGEG